MPLLDAFHSLSVEARTALILFGGFLAFGGPAVWLGLICGNALNQSFLTPLGLEAKRGIEASVEARLLNGEMV